MGLLLLLPHHFINCFANPSQQNSNFNQANIELRFYALGGSDSGDASSVLSPTVESFSLFLYFFVWSSVNE